MFLLLALAAAPLSFTTASGLRLPGRRGDGSRLRLDAKPGSYEISFGKPRSPLLQRNDNQWPPYHDVRKSTDLTAPVPWPRHETEIMVDVSSVNRYYMNQVAAEREAEGMKFMHDPLQTWPVRLIYACRRLARVYGRDVAPSPWKPIILVHDSLDPRSASKHHATKGQQYERWVDLKRAGPRDYRGMTLATANMYVDQSVQMRGRADREILYMLEMVTRDWPRKQILITDDPVLQEDARDYAAVRGPEWLEDEIRTFARRNETNSIVDVLKGYRFDGLEDELERLPLVWSRAIRSSRIDGSALTLKGDWAYTAPRNG